MHFHPVRHTLLQLRVCFCTRPSDTDLSSLMCPHLMFSMPASAVSSYSYAASFTSLVFCVLLIPLLFSVWDVFALHSGKGGSRHLPTLTPCILTIALSSSTLVKPAGPSSLVSSSVSLQFLSPKTCRGGVRGARIHLAFTADWSAEPIKAPTPTSEGLVLCDERLSTGLLTPRRRRAPNPLILVYTTFFSELANETPLFRPLWCRHLQSSLLGKRQC